MAYSAHYAKMDPRRRQEMHEAGMINEDHSKIANLPTEVKYMEYPKEKDYMPELIDDTLRGVDRQMLTDNSKRKSGFMPHKY